ncbi:L-2-4-diaminobutyrate decarboxylase [Penicillium vulpinum]|uniref:Uncharacterized protein n=1 Tax=Penicillium vulpinum TaxID=29845 RepID=A0A1V6S842_9EURO|nr:L-2-4-diaminobutyrate decarboxylase [Penicillium vulpinum]KAJ5972312.1 L-2-4-diaminobutyrate decarboxylase [Penicillium vulpinum]OQE09889.1 hypothetical protein PENVUL_c005G02533 [Penicillium vulpinum]
MLIPLSHEPENVELVSILQQAQSLVTGLLKSSPTDPSSPISRIPNLEGIEAIQRLAIPGEPQDITSVIREALSIFDNRMRLDHPKCFAYIPSCPSPLAYFGDFLTSIFNVNASMWTISSGPSAIEASLILWLASQVGLPSSAGGCFVSGGSMANMTGIIAARDQMLLPEQRANAIIYVSDQTHISVAKGLHMIGFCDYQIRVIPTDSKFCLDCKALQQTIDGDRRIGRLPFLIIASCGSTNTGSIDPLHAIADITRNERMWLHVDGAYGASIALSSTKRHLVDGLGRADSISWDGHKWLFQTYGCGIVLVRDKKSLEDSFKIDAEYIRTSLAPDGSTNFYNVSPELSRPARAISLWFTLRVLGHNRIGEMIDQGFTLASTAEHELRLLPNWEIVSPAISSIVVFRFSPPGLDIVTADSLNSKISARLLDENSAAIMTTKIRGRIVLRLCAINPAVHPDTISLIVYRMNSIAKEELSFILPVKEPQAVPNYIRTEGYTPVGLKRSRI